MAPRKTAAGSASTKTAASGKPASGVKKSAAAKKTATKGTAASGKEAPRRSNRLAEAASRQGTPAAAPSGPPPSAPPASAPAGGPPGGGAPPPPPPASAPVYISAGTQTTPMAAPPIASSTFGVLCTYGPTGSQQSGILRGILQVFPDRDGVESRLEYRATFEIVPADDSQEPEVCGFVDSWRIDRATFTKPNARAAWIPELLRPAPSAAHSSGAVMEETRLCLKALYTNTGNLRNTAEINANPLRQALTNDGLMFIQMIVVSGNFQGQKLLSPMLQCYRKMLRLLPEWRAFNDTLLLVPAAPEGEDGKVYGDMDIGAVEDLLETIYAKPAIDFQTIVRQAQVSNTRIRVMGRRVQNPGEL